MSAATKKVPRIVVGVDGSPPSRAALRWAVREAESTGGAVDAILAWQTPIEMHAYVWAPLYEQQPGDFEEAARKTLEGVISNEVDPADSQRVTSRVVNGHPAQVLIDASADADLLVVGSRGHSAFAEALLGSVGEHCVHHAHCPVLIIRGEPAQAAAAVRAELVVPGATA